MTHVEGWLENITHYATNRENKHLMKRKCLVTGIICDVNEKIFLIFKYYSSFGNHCTIDQQKKPTYKLD